MEKFNIEKLENLANGYEKKLVKKVSKILNSNKQKLIKWAKKLDSQTSKGLQEDLKLLNELFQELNYEFQIPRDKQFVQEVGNIALEELKSNTNATANLVFDLVNTQFTNEEIEKAFSNLEKTMSLMIKEVDYKNLTLLLQKRLIEGWDYQVTVERFLSELAFDDEKRAMRIARTETTRLVAEIDSMLYQKLDIKNVKISIANSACDLCRDKARFVYQTTDKILPIHPNCRCRMIAVIPDSWLS